MHIFGATNIECGNAPAFCVSKPLLKIFHVHTTNTDEITAEIKHFIPPMKKAILNKLLNKYVNGSLSPKLVTNIASNFDVDCS